MPEQSNYAVDAALKEKIERLIEEYRKNIASSSEELFQSEDDVAK